MSKECGICYNAMNIVNGMETSCGHLFHTSCIIKWENFCSSKNNPPTCPFCRFHKIIPVYHIDTENPLSKNNQLEKK